MCLWVFFKAIILNPIIIKSKYDATNAANIKQKLKLVEKLRLKPWPTSNLFASRPRELAISQTMWLINDMKLYELTTGFDNKKDESSFETNYNPCPNTAESN